MGLGDSLTEGVGDPMPGGRLRGWAELLAGALHEPLVRLAWRGASVPDVRRDQLPLALPQLGPGDLATLLVGTNDVVGPPAFDSDRYGEDLRACLEALAATGAMVLTGTLHEVDLAFPAWVRRRTGALLERIDTLNEQVRGAAAATGALVLDLEALQDTDSAALLSIDRLHPSEVGHRAIAEAALDVLVDAGRAPAGLALPTEPGAGRRGQARWLLTVGAPWFSGVQVARLRETPCAARGRAGAACGRAHRRSR